MGRPIAVVGAPSSIGAHPYADGEARHLDRAPDVLRERGLIERLHAVDFGDVTPHAYRDYTRPARGARNEGEVITYSRDLASRVAAATAHGRFALVLGGDCSIVLGCLLGTRRTARGRIGLAYVDAHADWATPEESSTGSVAAMTLRLATGHVESPLAHLARRRPLVDAQHVALIGRRDGGESRAGQPSPASSILNLPVPDPDLGEFEGAGVASLTRVAAPGARGFWIQLDADVLNPAVMYAVDAPEPGGPMPHELAALLAPLVRHPRVMGLSLTTYDPALDPDRSCARRLIALLEKLFAS